jgi:hypothetical protein
MPTWDFQIVFGPDSTDPCTAHWPQTKGLNQPRSAERDGNHSIRWWSTRTSLHATLLAGMLNWMLMRRVIIVGLVLSVVATGLVSLSTCALLSAQVAECAQVTDPSPCEHMDSHSGQTQISKGADKSCCSISQAPLPQLQYKAVEVGPAVTQTVSQQILFTPTFGPCTTLFVVEYPSPPSFQSLLCTFLI